MFMKKEWIKVLLEKCFAEIPGQRLGQSFLLIGGIAVGVIAAIAIGLVIYRKKKKGLFAFFLYLKRK